MPDEGDLRTSVERVGKPHLEYAIQATCPYHLEGIQGAVSRWVKVFRGLNCGKRLKALKLQSLEIRRLGNDLVLIHRILYNQLNCPSSPEGQG